MVFENRCTFERTTLQRVEANFCRFIFHFSRRARVRSKKTKIKTAEVGTRTSAAKKACGVRKLTFSESNQRMTHIGLGQPHLRALSRITGLWQPGFHGDVAFWSFDVGSSYHWHAEVPKCRIVHPPIWNVSWVWTVVRQVSFTLRMNLVLRQ